MPFCSDAVDNRFLCDGEVPFSAALGSIAASSVGGGVVGIVADARPSPMWDSDERTDCVSPEAML